MGEGGEKNTLRGETWNCDPQYDIVLSLWSLRCLCLSQPSALLLPFYILSFYRMVSQGDYVINICAGCTAGVYHNTFSHRAIRQCRARVLRVKPPTNIHAYCTLSSFRNHLLHFSCTCHHFYYCTCFSTQHKKITPLPSSDENSPVCHRYRSMLACLCEN
ncbi:hypothetical protein AMECASPLE_001867 [Ameca splendens]|uniref:Uncharacterized protein n=1 Tax=Ameca splendens TaxID=208324 RepID=A0ABV0Y955_9TELE